MAKLVLENVSKVYDNNFKAIDKFSLEVKDKEFLVLVGPSGCGKSTVLRIIAGLEDISNGKIFIGDKLVNDVESKDRNVSMVFQNYALYPHKNVYDNLSFGLKLRKFSKEYIDKKVKEVSKILDLEELLKRKPNQLSGGQKQRVALGRAIVRDPEVFLMDEPLSNLDAKLRNIMRSEITKLQRDLQTTMVYVTHDQTEAMTMGNRIVIMKEGYIQQVGTPDEIYNKPKNMFVADFIGTPSINFLDNNQFEKYIKNDSNIRGNTYIGVRPDNIKIEEGSDFIIAVIENLGSEKIIHLENNELNISVKTQGEFFRKVGDKVSISIYDLDKINLFDKASKTLVEF